VFSDIAPRKELPTRSPSLRVFAIEADRNNDNLASPAVSDFLKSVNREVVTH
jgi:hypothetical protein